MSAPQPYTNALAGETSPYLLQHAHNPVAWYPWGEEALTTARQEGKPILLSIGYSACHWCHVMAHESFEDEATARLMNELFVCIKVDREERPDLDRIYQTAHHMLAQRPGGWPLTMFLTHDDHTPFFGGTYFPRERRYGMPAFRELLEGVARAYREQQAEIRTQNAEMITALRRVDATRLDPGVQLDGAPLELARQQIQQAFDPRHGGFGQAPKFPHPTNIERLLRHEAATRAIGRVDEQAGHMALFTLERMARGGIYDQLGGGFSRYSVDDYWMIPHFEKMLYDNGPLLSLYSEAWQLSPNPLFQRVVAETAGWVMREMQSPEGGYYSSLDADSEGEEGRFYVWEPDQVRALLTADQYAVLAYRFGLDREANFEGRWHLHAYHSLEETAAHVGMDAATARALLDEARAILFREREKRVRPGRDDKVLTAWNGLMIKGMATAARVFREPAWADSASRALDFLRAHMWRDGRLLATYKDGRAHLDAYIDDYAYLMDGILALLAVRWRTADLELCLALAEVLLERFEDRENGGFFFTADDHEALIHRPKSLGDDSMPSGNGIAAHVLIRLGHLLGETRYLDAAERTLRAAWPAIGRLPHAHNALLLALEEYLNATTSVVIRGPAQELARWQDTVNPEYAPRRQVFAIPAAETHLPGALAERSAPDSGAIAYLCEGFTCSPPITSPEELHRRLTAV